MSATKKLYNKTFLFILVILMMQFALSDLYSESYEDFRDQRDFVNIDNIRRAEGPLADIKNPQRVDFLQDLRGAVRDEIDTSMSKERKAKRTNIDEDRIIRDVRRIVKEEIEDAIRIKEAEYLSAGTIELGGSISAQFDGLGSGNSSRFQILPVFNYFFVQGFGLSFKGEVDMSFDKNDEINYNICAGPIFVFGLNRRNSVCFFTGIYAGVVSNDRDLGFRYANEMGFKFVLTRGVLLSASLMVAVDLHDRKGDLENKIMPAIGITAWF